VAGNYGQTEQELKVYIERKHNCVNCVCEILNNAFIMLCDLVLNNMLQILPQSKY